MRDMCLQCHIIPLAAPGVVAQGLKWMFNSSSPFYMKPRWDIDFFKWLWFFQKSANPNKVKYAIPIIKDITLFSRELYQDIYNSGDLGVFQWERKGILMMYKTDVAGEEEIHTSKLAKGEGLEVNELNLQQLKKIEPKVADSVKGAVHYECDVHTTPNEFMEKLKAYLIKNGVIIHINEEVVDFEIGMDSISQIITTKGTYYPDEVVLTAGAWSSEIVKKLRLRLSMQAGKGYRINVPSPTGINYPAILLEKRVAITPMNTFTRFAGTMELSGINHKIHKERVDAIATASESYYDNLHIPQAAKDDAQCGLRPVSPDGLPYIGKVAPYHNLYIGAGHAMMGWSMGPGTGKLISQLICKQPLAMNMEGFNPNRKF